MIVTKIYESGDHVGFDTGGRGNSRLFTSNDDGFELVLQFDNDALSSFAADAGNASEPRDVSSANGWN